MNPVGTTNSSVCERNTIWNFCVMRDISIELNRSSGSILIHSNGFINITNTEINRIIPIYIMNNGFTILDISNSHNASYIGNTISYIYIEVFHRRSMLHIVLQCKFGTNYDIIHIAIGKIVVKINRCPGECDISAINWNICLD